MEVGFNMQVSSSSGGTSSCGSSSVSEFRRRNVKVSSTSGGAFSRRSLSISKWRRRGMKVKASGGAPSRGALVLEKAIICDREIRLRSAEVGCGTTSVEEYLHFVGIEH
jgi:hypothetical protein